MRALAPPRHRVVQRQYRQAGPIEDRVGLYPHRRQCPAARTDVGVAAEGRSEAGRYHDAIDDREQAAESTHRYQVPDCRPGAMSAPDISDRDTPGLPAA